MQLITLSSPKSSKKMDSGEPKTNSEAAEILDDGATRDLKLVRNLSDLVLFCSKAFDDLH